MRQQLSYTLAFLLFFGIPETGTPTAIAASRIEIDIERLGSLVRLTGQLLESNSGRAISNASIMVQCADLVLAHKQTDLNGNFVLLIPEEKIEEAFITLKIRYREHIFTRDRLLPESQDLQIEINRTLFLESTPVEDYRLPIHDLTDPRVGQVLIRTNYVATAPAANLPVQI
ncbi:MAG: hypothetical protein NWR72_00725 [Bacteroidia bacterium]|nr:hypothetical protein [Bacteroidia bacterium]